MACENNCPLCKCDLPKGSKQGVMVGAHLVDSESGLPTERVQVHMSKTAWDKIAEVANGTKAEA